MYMYLIYMLRNMHIYAWMYTVIPENFVSKLKLFWIINFRTDALVRKIK